MKTHHLVVFMGVLVTGVFVCVQGCKDSTTSPTPVASLMMKVDYNATLAKLVPDSVQIDSAKILLRKIKFESAASAESADVYVNTVIIHLDLTGRPTTVAVGVVRNGVYDRVKYNLHKPEDTEVLPDSEFKPGPSGSDRFSVIIKGQYRGSPFVYRSRINVDQEVTIDPPVTVSDSKKDVNVTLVVNPSRWFFGPAGVLDPSAPSNESVIDENIKNSFKRAFRDNNRDGFSD